MSETRTILGYISRALLEKPEIAFPEVKAWIVEPGKVETRSLAHAFPNTGTVYLHAGNANNVVPLPDHYGIFECEPPEVHRGYNTWRVGAVDESISQLVSINSSLKSSLDFYAALDAMQNLRLANTFCGNGRFYFLTQDGWIVGPYAIKNGSISAATERTMRWNRIATEVLEAGETDMAFISARTLGTGIIFPPTLQDAIKRIFKLIAKNGHCAFLSRQHISELAQEMMDVSVTEELSWLVDGMNQLLPRLKDTLEASNELSCELLKNAAIGNLLETRWREAHSRMVGQEEAKLEATTAALQKVETKYEELLKTTTELSKKADELQTSIACKRKDAQTAFQAEIARLSADPSQIAILSSLLSQQPIPVKQNVSASFPWSEVTSPLEVLTARNGEAIVRGLFDAGLSIRCAHDVATVALAAFLSGQVVTLRNPLAALFAEVILFGSGHSSCWACEVPAGLLEPIPPPTIATGNLGVVFHGANRSDYNLVIAGIRQKLLKQLIGGIPSCLDVIFTLDATEGLVVEQPLPIGPCISEDFLAFSDSPNESEIRPLPLRNSFVIPAMGASDFEEMFPESFAKIHIFKNSFLVVMARKYCAALKIAGCEATRVKEMFLKYWLLPRLTRAETAELLKTEDALCKKDAQIAILLTSCRDE